MISHDLEHLFAIVVSAPKEKHIDSLFFGT